MCDNLTDYAKRLLDLEKKVAELNIHVAALLFVIGNLNIQPVPRENLAKPSGKKSGPFLKEK